MSGDGLWLGGCWCWDDNWFGMGIGGGIGVCVGVDWVGEMGIGISFGQQFVVVGYRDQL